MKLKWLFYGALLFIFSLSGCSEMLNEEEGAYVPHGSILVTDRQNQLVNWVDTNTGVISSVTSSTGPDPIDIFISGNYAYILSSDTSSIVKKYDLDSGKWAGTVYYPNKGYAQQIASDSKHLYISFEAGKRLEVVSIDSFTSIFSKDLSQNAQGIIYESDKVYICVSDGYSSSYTTSRIAVLSTNDLNTVTYIPSQKNPLFITSDGKGYLYVSCAGSYANDGGITRVDTSTTSTNDIVTGKSFGVIEFANNRLYVADYSGGLCVYETNGTLVTNLLDGESISDILIDGDYAYALGGNYGEGKNIYRITLSDNVIDRTYTGVIKGDWGAAMAIYK